MTSEFVDQYPNIDKLDPEQEDIYFQESALTRQQIVCHKVGLFGLSFLSKHVYPHISGDKPDISTRFCQLFHQRQQYPHHVATAVFDAPRQHLIDVLLIIQPHVMPAHAVREGAGFGALLVTVFFA